MPKHLGRIAAGVALLIALLGAAVVAFTRGGHTDGPGSPARSTRPPQSTGAPRPASAASRLTTVRTQLQPTRTPFLVYGARFAVFSNPKQPWARAVRARAPGPGLRWALVEVLTRNLTRRQYDSRTLRYRIEDGTGHVYFPSPAVGTGALAGHPEQARRLGVGQLVTVQLGFAIPSSRYALSLFFEPALLNGVPLIQVPLAA